MLDEYSIERRATQIFDAESKASCSSIESCFYATILKTINLAGIPRSKLLPLIAKIGSEVAAE